MHGGSHHQRFALRIAGNLGRRGDRRRREGGDLSANAPATEVRHTMLLSPAKREIASRMTPGLLIVGCLVYFGFARPDIFFSTANLSNYLTSVSVLGVIV